MTVNFKRIIPTVLAGVLVCGCSASPASDVSNTDHTVVAYNEASTGHYDVVYRQDSIILDGDMSEGLWETVAEISGSFHYPWEAEEAPLTVFKAYHDNTDFYFGFEVTDDDVLVEKEWKDENTVDLEDRVELFFAKGSVDKPGSSGMIPYYATEVDALGRVHDYSVVYYRNFDSDCGLKGAAYAAKMMDTGYSVEGRIPMETLREIDVLNANDVMRAGVFRAEFSTKNDAYILMRWISWVDPKTKNPDFHVDSAFGEFRFLKQ